MWTVALPLSVPVTKAKSFTLNLNPYRNAHHHTLDKAKKTFKAAIWSAIRQLPTLPAVVITYTLFPANRRSVDVANVCSIQDKFFCDALVEAGRLPDDSFEHVVSVCYRFGGVDRSNPRVEATIEPAGSAFDQPDLVTSVHARNPPGSQPKENPLKITMIQPEIEDAVRAHIRNMIQVREGMEINMDFSATRGADGLTVFIDIVPGGSDSKPALKASTAPAAIEPPKPTAVAGRQISHNPEAQEEEETPAPTRTASPFRRQPAPVVEAEPGEEETHASSQQEPGADEAGEAAPGQEEVTQAKGPSIFAGLRRPSNRPEPVAEAAE